MSLRGYRSQICAVAAVLVVAAVVPARGQTKTAAQAEAPAADALGRTTPRGTLTGFLAAARKGDNDLARRYLNTPLGAAAAADLAHQLFVVLDVRLKAHIAQISDAPEGSRANPLAPNDETIGSIEHASGSLTVVVERVQRGKAEPIWLFSPKTLAAIPEAYGEVAGSGQGWVPAFLLERRVWGIRLFDWASVLIGLIALYLLMQALNRFVGLPMAARLLVLALVARWLIAKLPLSLMTRQTLSLAISAIGAAAVAWLVIVINGVIERYFAKRIPAANYAATISLLRVARRACDVLVLLIAGMVLLRRAGIDPTPVLAGLGVGGVAVALAAQKTLENVIAGASLIFDQAVRIGDFLRIGTLEGTVEHIGLRSTRIRTLDRTLVSVPNSQIANMSVETLSARDMFWFHPVIALRYTTTTDQLRAVLAGIEELLTADPAVDRGSIRVRLLRLSAFSLDVEVFAYAIAADWPAFLAIQERLLFGITNAVEHAGAEIALPSQTMYLQGAHTAEPAVPPTRDAGPRNFRRARGAN